LSLGFRTRRARQSYKEKPGKESLDTMQDLSNRAKQSDDVTTATESSSDGKKVPPRRNLLSICHDANDAAEKYVEALPGFSKVSGSGKFLLAQVQVAVILTFACIGNTWEPSYPRNENHSMMLFWIFHAVLLILSLMTWTHIPRERVTLLSRAQTEEWKGWMQFSFIMYHYYRAWSAYNWIRVFVSSYVWMTGFGNFLYFDKKRDFSIQRAVSMFLRINYFPLLLSWATGVSIDLYYVVPLHTAGFFMTYLTCLLAVKLEEKASMTYWKSRILAIAISFGVQIIFFETSYVESLEYFSHELYVRFQIDKYSAVLGIINGLYMKKASEFISWAYGDEHRNRVQLMQCTAGTVLIFIWYSLFGSISDKLVYNPIHPYIFIFPMLGWILLRNSHRYLCECHSGLLEFLGRHTLETYVLQFHLFMNHDVQSIPIIIPGCDENIILNILNMILCGTFFVLVAVWARKVTITTQNTMVGFMKLCSKEDSEIVKEDEKLFINA